MQRVAAALSAPFPSSLALPALQQPPTPWNQAMRSSRQARRSSLPICSRQQQQQQKKQGQAMRARGDANTAAVAALTRRGGCQGDDRGGRARGAGSSPELASSARGMRSGRAALGDREHRKRQRPAMADCMREYAAEAWWPDDAAGSDGEKAEAGGEESGELWGSRPSLPHLSLIGTLLGFSPSTLDEWLLSHEAKRRLASSSAAADGDSLEDAIDSSLGGLREKLALLARFPGILAGIAPHVPQSDGSAAAEGMAAWSCSLCPRWMTSMANTYGGSLMLLVGLGYLTQGFRCFPWFAVGYMLKDGLQVDPGYMQFLLSSAALPMVAKPIYGIISDTVYIGGAHRVPYLAISAILQVISWGALAWCPKATSSAALLTAALTFGNLGAAIADVMNDALVAEVSKKQKSSSAQGELQSFVWLIMATGGLVGNLLGGFALKNLPLKTMYSVFIVLQGLHLLACLFANEASFGLAPSLASQIAGDNASEGQERKKGSKAATEGCLKGKKNLAGIPKQGCGLLSQLDVQVRLLGQLLKKKDIWNTLLWFCASYAVVPVLGSSIFFYQTQVLRIDPTFIGFSRMVGQVGLMVGSQLYGGILKGLPLRQVLGSVQLLLSICMLSDLVLVKRLNIQFGIPDEFYVLGASALVDCVSQFKVLPVIVRLGQLCPRGSEGSLMAFFSSLHCMAGLCSGYFGVALARYLRISSQSFEGLPVGILIQALFAALPILFIHLIPGEANSSKAADKYEDKSL